MGKKQLKKDQRMGYHKVFKTGKKSGGERRKKTASRKVK